MKEIMNQVANRMASKIRVARNTMENFEAERANPFYSEWKGMEQLLDTMGIEFSYEYDDNYEITAITVGGQRVEIG